MHQGPPPSPLSSGSRRRAGGGAGSAGCSVTYCGEHDAAASARGSAGKRACSMLCSTHIPDMEMNRSIVFQVVTKEIPGLLFFFLFIH